MWYYHRDPDGREWGPFTPGQLTRLLNLEVLTSQSLIRAENSDVWDTYYAAPQPKDWFDEPVDENSEQKRLDGDRIAAQLELHTARQRVLATDLAPPAAWPRTDFAEDELSLVYAGPCEPVFHGGLGLKFGDGKNIAIQLHLSAVDRQASESTASWAEILTTLEQLKQNQQALAAKGHFRAAEFSPSVHLDVKCDAGVVRYGWTKFKHLCLPNDWKVEHLFITAVRERFIHVHVGYPYYLEILAGPKVLRFLALTANEASACWGR